MTTVVLVDDHPFVRKAVRSLLEAENDLVVVGESTDGFEGVQLIQCLKPDVAVLDLTMPFFNGQQAIRSIAEESPDTRIVVYSLQSQQAYITGAFDAGAHAYVVKGAPSEELVKAIKTSVKG